MGACYSLDKAGEDKCKVQPVGTLSGRFRGGQWGLSGWLGLSIEAEKWELLN